MLREGAPGVTVSVPYAAAKKVWLEKGGADYSREELDQNLRGAVGGDVVFEVDVDALGSGSGPARARRLTLAQLEELWAPSETGGGGPAKTKAVSESPLVAAVAQLVGKRGDNAGSAGAESAASANGVAPAQNARARLSVRKMLALRREGGCGLNARDFADHMSSAMTAECTGAPAPAPACASASASAATIADLDPTKRQRGSVLEAAAVVDGLARGGGGTVAAGLDPDSLRKKIAELFVDTATLEP